MLKSTEKGVDGNFLQRLEELASAQGIWIAYGCCDREPRLPRWGSLFIDSLLLDNRVAD